MNKILEVKFGSYLYGTNTEHSDLDIKGIHLPSSHEIVMGRVKKNVSTVRPKQEFEKNNKDDIDFESFSLMEYLRLLCSGQTVALDMLFSPDSFHVFKGDRYDIFKTIYANKDRLISRNVAAFYQYALRQAAKYGLKGSRVRAARESLDFFSGYGMYVRLIEFKDELDRFVGEGRPYIEYVDIKDMHNRMVKHLQICGRKYPLTNPVKEVLESLQKIFNTYGKRALEAEQNNFVDAKACSHAVRVNLEAKELLLTGHITFPCPERKLLIDIKTGKMPYKEVEILIENGLKELEEAKRISKLRDTPDVEWVDTFVYDIYSDIVRRG